MGLCLMCKNEERRIINGICTACLQIKNKEILGKNEYYMNKVSEEHSQGNDGGSLLELVEEMSKRIIERGTVKG